MVLRGADDSVTQKERFLFGYKLHYYLHTLFANFNNGYRA